MNTTNEATPKGRAVSRPIPGLGKEERKKRVWRRSMSDTRRYREALVILEHFHRGGSCKASVIEIPNSDALKGVFQTLVALRRIYDAAISAGL